MKISEIRQKRIEKFIRSDIYPVISSEFCNGRKPVEILQSIAEAGAGIVQLREKNISKLELFRLAQEFRKLTAAYGMLLIINDHVDLALSVNADGVHLGQDDLPIEAARRIAPDIILGSSTHSEAEAIEAQTLGADYINVGPIFATQTKQVGCPALGLDLLKTIIPKVKVPFSVMGGIKEKHLAELIASGARHIAMVTEITQAPDVTARTEQLRGYFKS